MIQHSVAEWGSIGLGSATGLIPELIADRLVRAAEQSALPRIGRGQILRRDHLSLRARNVVGIVATDGHALEILPKTEVHEGASEASARQMLVRMLEVALDVPIATGQAAPIDWTTDSLLDILIRAFADQLLEAVRQGLPRYYVAHAEDLPVLRGRLDAVRQFSTLAANPQKLACRFDAMTADAALNQVLKAAIRMLAPLARRAETSRRLHELTMIYDGVSDVPPKLLCWQSVRIDRATKRWRPLLALARLFLGRHYQTTSLGQGAGMTLLFDMGRLFESYVAAMMVHALAGTDLRVVVQGGLKHCLQEQHTGVRLFQTRPDLLIKRGRQTVLIADTKWKLLEPVGADRKQGIAQADIYQMMAYGQIYACDRLLLIYPHSGAPCGPTLVPHAVAQTATLLGWGTVDLADPTVLPTTLRALTGSMIAVNPAGPAAGEAKLLESTARLRFPPPPTLPTFAT